MTMSRKGNQFLLLILFLSLAFLQVLRNMQLMEMTIAVDMEAESIPPSTINGTGEESIPPSRMAESIPPYTINGTGEESIPPSRMEVHYFEMWNHNTSTIRIPEKYKNPFNILIEDDATGKLRRPLTSLEILQNVLHGEKYRAEFEAVEQYMIDNNGKHADNKIPVPQCLRADVQATRDLADRVVLVRSKNQTQMRSRQRRLNENKNKRKHKNGSTNDIKTRWPHEKMILSMPVLNVGFPKAGSSTLHAYFNCIGLHSTHNQDGKRMFRDIANDNRLDERYKAHGYMQLDANFGPGLYPQISLLDELHESFPNSTFVLNFRPIHDWIRSIRKWRGMATRMANFSMPGLTKSQGTTIRGRPLPLSNVQFAKWVCGHALHIREYVKEYPGHSLVELDLYDQEESSRVLYDLFQADTIPYHNASAAECWGHENKNEELGGKKGKKDLRDGNSTIIRRRE